MPNVTTLYMSRPTLHMSVTTFILLIFTIVLYLFVIFILITSHYLSNNSDRLRELIKTNEREHVGPKQSKSGVSYWQVSQGSLNFGYAVQNLDCNYIL